MISGEDYFPSFPTEPTAMGQPSPDALFLPTEAPSPGYTPAAGWDTVCNCSYCNHYNCHTLEVVCLCSMPACDGYVKDMHLLPNVNENRPGFIRPAKIGYSCCDNSWMSDQFDQLTQSDQFDQLTQSDQFDQLTQSDQFDQLMKFINYLPDLPSPPSPPRPPDDIMPSQTQTRPQIAKFLKRMLDGPDRDQSLITWSDREKGIFRVVNSRQLAILWGKQKNRPNMTFAKMARGIRERRKAGDFARLTLEEASRLPRRLVFKFGKSLLL